MNENWKISARCEKNCPWRLYASRMYNEDSIQVKTYVGKHECPRIWKESPNCKVAWLVKRYVDKFRLNPSMPITTFVETVKEERMVKILIKTAYRRIYICLGACKNGFKNGCRQLIGLDGCHLKGMFKDQLLSAVGMDANNQTWRAWTFISDKQKGLIPAFEKVLPNCNHRFYVKHLYTNYKADGFKGKELNDALWNVAKAITIADFRESMAKANRLNEKSL
ncbi:uncharacterized protein [Malus domestica]|uniref:uncharacterized protein n=1 Tax=Malus domestica TaxID=3750 RepID=UPI003976B298